MALPSVDLARVFADPAGAIDAEDQLARPDRGLEGGGDDEQRCRLRSIRGGTAA